ncbi:class F sortase [Pseudonocardia zijingensis]|uniref:class F sortase n=2 Tax=Pseudonocardia zijingensis TaxID=153376 RepID=UPI003618F78B
MARDPVAARRAAPGRVSRALVAAGAVCVLAGLTMLAPGPGAVVAPLDAPAPVRPGPPPDPLALHPAPVVDGELARLLAGEAPVPEPVRAGTVPVELVLPARDVRAPVVAVTTGPEGALVVPEPPSTVGWWSPSALPGGAAGTTVLAGHVDSATGGLGALAVLRHVGEGEEVVLTGADGRSVGYRVSARRQYAKAELPPEVFAPGGPPRLVLITCGGAFDRRTRHYADNVVVFAEPT